MQTRIIMIETPENVRAYIETLQSHGAVISVNDTFTSVELQGEDDFEIGLATAAMIDEINSLGIGEVTLRKQLT